MVACRYGISLLVCNFIDTSSLHSLMRYCVEHTERYSIITHAQVFSSIYQSRFFHKTVVRFVFYYMAVSRKDWKLPNSWLKLAKNRPWSRFSHTGRLWTSPIRLPRSIKYGLTIFKSFPKDSFQNQLIHICLLKPLLNNPVSLLRFYANSQHLNRVQGFLTSQSCSVHAEVKPFTSLRPGFTLHAKLTFTNLPNQNENNDCTKKVVGLIINEVVYHSVFHSIPVM